MHVKVKGEGREEELHPAEGIGQDEEPSEEEEVREVKGPAVPTLPSKEEVLRHRLTHRPFRSWCPHCVRGKGRERPHRKSTQKDAFEGVPKLVSDYFYIGQRKTQNVDEKEVADVEAERNGQTPVISLKDTHSKSIFAHVCPRKGADDRVVTRLIGDLDTLP